MYTQNQNHGRGESQIAIHRQVFEHRAFLLEEIKSKKGESVPSSEPSSTGNVQEDNNQSNATITDRPVTTADLEWDGISGSTSTSAGWGPFAEGPVKILISPNWNFFTQFFNDQNTSNYNQK